MKKEDLDNKIIEIVQSEILDISKEEIKWLYEAWFNGKCSEGKWIQNRGVICLNQNVPDNAYLRGIDLPFYFGDIEKSNKKIMIIGLDPLRNLSAFENAKKNEGHFANIYEDLLLSTPYALHAKEDKKEKNKYWQIIKNLKEDNFIYLTDLYKTFFKTHILSDNSFKVIRSYNYYKKENVCDNSREILLKEIKLINPDAIITFGNDVKNAIGQLFNKKINTLPETTQIKIADNSSGIKILPFIHPAAYDSDKKEFLTKNGIEIKVKMNNQDYALSFSSLIVSHLNL